MGMCTRLPHATAGEQTLDVEVTSPEPVGPMNSYWVDAVTSLRAVTHAQLNGKAAEILLRSFDDQRKQNAEVSFPRLRQLRTVARHIGPADVQNLHQLLRMEAERRSPTCAVPLEEVRVD